MADQTRSPLSQSRLPYVNINIYNVRMQEISQNKCENMCENKCFKKKRMKKCHHMMSDEMWQFMSEYVLLYVFFARLHVRLDVKAYVGRNARICVSTNAGTCVWIHIRINVRVFYLRIIMFTHWKTSSRPYRHVFFHTPDYQTKKSLLHQELGSMSFHQNCLRAKGSQFPTLYF
jgi:hypothetical protein